jgi:sugar phosphate isomerase/epimerase
MTNKQFSNLVENIQKCADTAQYTNLLFETHAGIGTHPLIVADILYKVQRENVGLVFDPINILNDGKLPHEMLKEVGEYVKHIHLKGSSSTNMLCAFGEGVNISEAVIEAMQYTNSFGIEYEGIGNILEGLETSYKNFKQLCAKKGMSI